MHHSPDSSASHSKWVDAENFGYIISFLRSASQPQLSQTVVVLEVCDEEADGRDFKGSEEEKEECC